jgi:hypothetical protein
MRRFALLLFTSVALIWNLSPSTAGQANPTRDGPAVDLAEGPGPGYVVYKTDQHEFTPGIENQGWWSPIDSNFNDNDNYFTGGYSTGDDHRNFFSFDLVGLEGPVVRAWLYVAKYVDWAGDPVETLTLYDVSTDPAILNSNEGVSQTIFDDLGSGTVYGSFDVAVPGPPRSQWLFELNDAGVAAINAAAGGWFSVGGRLVTSEGAGEYLFGGTSGDGKQWLVLRLAS